MIEHPEESHDPSLVTTAWAGAHQKLAVDQFVPLAVVGKGEDLVAGPGV